MGITNQALSCFIAKTSKNQHQHSHNYKHAMMKNQDNLFLDYHFHKEASHPIYVQLCTNLSRQVFKPPEAGNDIKIALFSDIMVAITSKI